MAEEKRKPSKTYSLKISKNAEIDIDAILNYIAFLRHQLINAIRVGDKIFSIFHGIEQNPLAYRECEEIPSKTKMYRKAVCMSWLIIYRIRNKKILILGVIHGSRKPSKIRNLQKVK